jgi:hypothetical protein
LMSGVIGDGDDFLCQKHAKRRARERREPQYAMMQREYYHEPC